MNRYLEKIAEHLSEDQLNHHAMRGYWKGAAGGFAGGLVPLPGASLVGEWAGRSHELAQVKSKITGHKAGIKDVRREGVRSVARSLGRTLTEAVGGVGVGGAIGAGIGALASRSAEGAKAGGAIGAGIGASVGAIHGGYRSNKNSLKDFAREWGNEKHHDSKK